MFFGKRRGNSTDWSIRIFHCRHFWFFCRYKKLRNTVTKCRSQWPRGLRRGSAAARLLGLRVRIAPGAWMSVVSVLCCAVDISASGRSLVQRSPTECGVSESDREASILRRPWPTGSCCTMKRKALTVCWGEYWELRDSKQSEAEQNNSHVLSVVWSNHLG
jgi:hypothetical protein